MRFSILRYQICDFLNRGWNKVMIEPGLKASFGKCGKHVKIGKCSDIKPAKNIQIGNYSEIGPQAVFWTTRAKIIIGDHVIFGPRTTIITGDHPTNVVGKCIADIKDEDKTPNLDQNVVIGNDVWIGCNVTILKGVQIADGCVIAAGSVLTKSTEPYSIYAGVPARKIKDRFSEEQLRLHLNALSNSRS